MPESLRTFLDRQSLLLISRPWIFARNYLVALAVSLIPFVLYEVLR